MKAIVWGISTHQIEMGNFLISLFLRDDCMVLLNGDKIIELNLIKLSSGQYQKLKNAMFLSTVCLVRISIYKNIQLKLKRTLRNDITPIRTRDLCEIRSVSSTLIESSCKVDLRVRDYSYGDSVKPYGTIMIEQLSP